MESSSIVADVAVAQAVAPSAKPAFQPYYKAPADINASLIIFEKKEGRKSSVPGKKTTTFSINMKPAEGADVEASTPLPEVAGRGGRGGRGRGAAGRGGRGGRPKMGALAIKPVSSLRTKYGINVGVSQVGGDTAIVAHLKENPRHINAMAAGMIETPPGVHFEIIFFLDPAEPEHQRLEQLSNECREAFEQFTYELPAGMISDKFEVNGFVRVSKKTDERYIVLTMSTMHTVEQSKFFPTPFYNQANDTVLWDALVQHGFRAEIEFKVNHVMLVGDSTASFKSYISSCKLIETPKLALSEARQAQEAYTEKIKEAVRKAAASAAPGTGMPAKDACFAEVDVDHDDAEAQLAALSAKAVEAAPAKKKAKAHSVAALTAAPRKKKVVAAPEPEPEPEVEAAASEAEASEPQVSETEEAQKTPVPSGVIRKTHTARA